jgi:hypothetical protein
MKNANARAVKREKEEEGRQEETGVTGTNQTMIYGPENDGTYVIEFKTSVPEPS